MAFLREHDQLGRNTHHLSAVERRHTLIVRNTEIHAAVDAQNRSVPFGYILGRAVGIVPFCLGIVTPRRTALLHTAESLSVTGRAHLARRIGVFLKTAVVPVAEPHLLSLAIHIFLIENAGMGDKAVESIFVDTCKVINGISAIGCTTCSHLADIRLSLKFSRGSKVVLDIQTGIITRNLFAPVLTESRSATPVRHDHHITLGSHKTVVPSVGP